MSGSNPELIHQAIEFLTLRQEHQLARAVQDLLDKSKVIQTCYVSDENLEGIVRTLYPPDPEWTEEMKERHYRHLRCAIAINPSALNEDLKEILNLGIPCDSGKSA